jgi:hypothetical protein
VAEWIHGPAARRYAYAAGRESGKVTPKVNGCAARATIDALRTVRALAEKIEDERLRAAFLAVPRVRRVLAM